MNQHFSCQQLADLGLPGYPGTRQGWDNLVNTQSWPFIEVRSRGRTGIRREYQPPPEVMALIEKRQRGELPEVQPAGKPGPVTVAPAKQPPAVAPVAPRINVEALAQALVVMTATAAPGETPLETARKAAQFYCYLEENGLVTPNGVGPGKLGNVA